MISIQCLIFSISGASNTGPKRTLNSVLSKDVPDSKRNFVSGLQSSKSFSEFVNESQFFEPFSEPLKPIEEWKKNEVAQNILKELISMSHLQILTSYYDKNPLDDTFYQDDIKNLEQIMTNYKIMFNCFFFSAFIKLQEGWKFKTKHC